MDYYGRIKMKQDIEQINKNLKDLLRHIKLVQDACHHLGHSLIEAGEIDLGKRLIANSFLHDNSKFYGIEWEYISHHSKIENGTKEGQDLAIMNHNTTNKHHPEYWDDIRDMPRVYLAEMICDWYARSTEFGTDLRSWIKESAAKRYGFTAKQKIYKDIKYFVDMLLENPF